MGGAGTISMGMLGDRMTVSVLYMLCMLLCGVGGVIAEANQSIAEERRWGSWPELFWGLSDNHGGCYLIANHMIRYFLGDINSGIKSKCGFRWAFEGVLSDEQSSGVFDLDNCCSIMIKIDSICNLIMLHVCLWGIPIGVEIRM